MNIYEAGVRKIVKKIVQINKNDNLHAMATAHRKFHLNIILGIDSSLNTNEIEYNFDSTETQRTSYRKLKC